MIRKWTMASLILKMADSMETICGMYMRKAIPGLYRISSYRAIGCRFDVLIRLALFLVSPLLLNAANPVGEQVVSGSISFDRTVPGVLTIGQGSERAIINWDDFSIDAGNLTQFLQPDTSSTALNRVIGGNPSSIYGQLQANGQIFLINPAGILVGASGRIDTKGLVASTLNLSDESFLSNARLMLSGDSDAAVQNLGQISASQGNVYLIARTVKNSGSIRASAGTVGLGGGSEVVLTDGGGISVLVGSGSVDNSGSITAASAELKAVRGNIYALAINNSGVVRANSLVNEGGRIVLKAEGATAMNSGRLVASGGEVRILGAQVGLDGSVDVSGANGGGTALIGGGFQGRADGVLNAQRTVVGANATINANAGENGDGGNVVVWADGLTSYNGNISARGGANGGNGGQVEVSGKENLAFNGGVDAGAANGVSGSILLDPRDLTIASSGSDDSELSASGLLAAAPNTTDDIAVSPGSITALTGSITLEASRDLTISSDLALNNQISGETVAFTAGDDLTVAAVVSTGGAAMTFTASSGGVNSSSATLTILGPTTGGDVTFNNDGGSGNIVLSASIPNSGKDLTFSSKTILGTDVTISGTDVTFSNQLNGDSTANARTLTITSSGTATFSNAIGNTGQIGTFAVDGGGTVALNAGTVKATTMVFENAVELGKNTTLTGTDIRFENTLDAAIAVSPIISINASGNTVFGDAVGLSGGTIASLVTNSQGTTSVKGSGVTATKLTLNDPVTVAANTTFTGQTIIFGKRLDADLEANSREIIFVASGNTTFRGAVGVGLDGVVGTSDDLGFGNLTTLTGGSTLIQGGLVKAEVQTYGDSVSVLGNTTFSGATITFDSTLSSGGGSPTLTFKSTGATTFNGLVGSSTLGGLITDSTGTTVIRTTSLKATTQTYNNPVLVGANLKLTGTTVTFKDTVDSASASSDPSLTVNATTTIFDTNAEVGQSNPLKSLFTNSAGTTTIRSGKIHATTLKLNDPVILESNTILSGSTVTLKAINGDLTANNRTLTVKANLETTLSGKIGGTGILASLTTDAPGSTRFTTSSISATTQTYFDPVIAGGGTTLNADENGAGTILFRQTVNGSSNGVGTINLNATTSTFLGTVGSVFRLANLTTDSAGASSFEGGTVKATTLTFSDPVTVTADTTFGGTTVTFNSTLDADDVANQRAVVITASGTTKFTGSVGASEKLLSLETDISGSVIFGVGGATSPTLQVLTTGAQTYGDLATIRADDPGVVLDGSGVEFLKSVNADSASKARKLIINATGITRFASSVGSTIKLGEITLDASGTTELDGGTVKATIMTFNNDVIIGRNATLTATDGTVTFAKTINGDVADTRTLKINATTTLISGVVGDSTILNSFKTDSLGTTTVDSGMVDATSVIFNDALILGANTTLTGTTVSVAGTVNGTTAGVETLTINADGVTTFGSDVGATTRLASVATDSAGSTTIKASEINSSTHTYGDNVTLNTSTVLQGATGGTQASTVTFGGSINGNSNNVRALEIKSSGATTFGGSVGSSTKLLSLTTDAGGSTVINSSGISATTQSFNDPVTVGADATLTGTTITIAGTLDGDSVAGARELTLNASGVTTLVGSVGGSVLLGSLITDAAGTAAINGGTVNSTTQIFKDPVTLGQNTILTGTTITFSDTINGASAGIITLTATASGTFSLEGAVGGTASLASVTSGNSGTTSIKGNSVTTSGLQTYNNNVVIAANTTLSGSGFTFAGTLNADSASNVRTLAISSSGLMTFSGNIGDTASLGKLTPSGGGGVAISGASVNGTIQDFSAEAVTLGADVVFSGTTLTFAALNGNGKDLTISATGAATFNGAVSAVVDFVSGSGGTTVIGANIDTTGTQTFSDSAMTLATDVTLTSTGVGSNGDITINSTIDGAHNLVIDSPGTAILAGAIGNTTALTSFTANNGGTTQTIVSGGVVTTSGTQTFADGLDITTDTVFTASGVTFPATSNNSDANGNDVTLGITGNLNLGADFFAGTINDLSVSASGGVTVGGALTTIGRQTFGDALTLSSNSTLSGTGITFAAIIGATHDLTVFQRGVGLFGGAISGIGALQTGTTGLTILSADLSVGSIDFQNPVVLASDRSMTTTGTLDLKAVIGNGKNLTLNSTGTLTLTGRVQGVAALNVTGLTTINAGTGGGLLSTVSTTGSQTYNSAVTLGADAILAGTAITLGAVTGGGNDLTVSATGTSTFGGAVTGVVDLLSDGGGTTVVGADITSTGSQIYSDAFQLSANSTLTAPALTLASVAGGGFNLTLAGSGAGTSTFGGGVSGVAILAVTSGTGGIVLSGSSVSTTGTQTYSNPVSLAADTTLTGTTITTSGSATLDGTGDGTESLTVSGNVVFGAAIGGTASKALEFVNVSGTTGFTGGVTTTTAGGGTGNQTYTGNVTLNGSTTLSGNVVLFGTDNITDKVDGNAQNLVLNFSGTTTLASSFGERAGNKIAALTLGNGGSTTLLGGITTTGNQVYGESLTLSGATTLNSGASDILVAGVSGGGFDLTLTSTGAKTLSGTIASVSNFAVTAGGTGITINGASITTTGTQAYGETVALGGDTTLTGTTPTFAATAVAGGGFDLTLDFSGTTTISSTFTGIKNLATGNAGGTTISGGTVTTTGTQTYGDAVTLGAATTLVGTDITLAAVDAANFNLTLNGTGTTSINSTLSNLANLASGNGGTTTLSGNITSTGTQTFADSLTLTTDTTINSGASAISVAGVAGGGFDLTLTSTGAKTLAGDIASVVDLTVTTGGTGTTISGSSISTTGIQIYGETITLGADSVLAGTTPTFAATAVTGAGFDLTLNFSDTTVIDNTFSGIKNFASGGGGGITLNGGTFTTTGTMSFSDSLTLGAAPTVTGTSITLGAVTGSGGNFTVDGSGILTLGGAISSVAALTVTDSSVADTGTITINAGGLGIVTTGIQTYDRAITLAGQAIFGAGTANIIFVETITGAGNLINITTTGNAEFRKSATGLSTLATSSGGQTIFGSNGGGAVSITTSGTQLYADEVDSWVDATLTGSSVTLSGGKAIPLLGVPSASITTVP